MPDAPEMTCKEFYFQHIVPVEASPDDYRRFFEMLWQAHGEVVFQHACARLGNQEDARDVCQDAFVRAMQYVQKNPGRIPLKVNFRAWLRAIARNLILDRFRRVMVRPGRSSSELLETAPVEQPPEERLVRSEDLAILRKCLDSLTERARTILTLRDLEGKSEKVVAGEIGSNPNAVCVALHRARKVLRECVTTGLETD